MNILKKIMNFIVIVILSLAINAAALILALCFVFINKKLYKKIKERLFFLQNLKKKISPSDNLSVFFCSSAGEYEQAKPIMDRLQKAGRKIIILFFSPSGYLYAKKRFEQTPFILSPLDTFWHWLTFFYYIRPKEVIIIRHELWPSFLYTAKIFCKTYLVNISFNSKKNSSLLKRLSQNFLFQWIDYFFVITPSQIAIFKELHNKKIKKVFLASDTKYDRVIERSLQQQDEEKEGLLLLKKIRSQYPLCLIVGSAWEKDIELVLDFAHTYSLKGKKILIIIAPHQLNLKIFTLIEEECKKRMLGVIRDLDEKDNSALQLSSVQIYIITQMGKLAELYQLAPLAFVGGAMHHKVHNVLEPAAHKACVAFGPLHHNSAEAINLLSVNLATVIKTSDDLKEWIEIQEKNNFTLGVKTTQFIKNLCGGSDTIVAHIANSTREEKSE